MNHPHPPKLYEVLKLLKKDRYIDAKDLAVFLAETHAEFEKGKPNRPKKLKAAMKSIRESLKVGSIPEHLQKYLAYGERLGFIGPDPDILPLPGEIEGVHFKSYAVTDEGDVALELYEEAQKAKPDEPTLLDRVLAALTVQQAKIMEYLWNKPIAKYQELQQIPGAWNDGDTTDRAVTSKLKKMVGLLNKKNLSVSLRISQAGKRVTLNR